MNKFACIFFLLFLFVSCNKEEMLDNAPEFTPKIVNVSFKVAVDQKTKISYDQDEDKFNPSWIKGEQVSIVADLKKKDDITAKFKVESGGRNAILGGDISNWAGNADLYAIYPYRDDYYGHKDGVFTVKVPSQTINAKKPAAAGSLTLDDSMENSVLIAKASNARFINEDSISAKDMEFKQVMSFLRFTLVHEGHELKRITLRSKSNKFFTEANISVGDSVKYAYVESSKTEEIYSDNIIPDASGTSIINFALLPTKIDDLEIEIQTICNKESYIYTKTVDNSIDFKRNQFNYFGDALKIDDFIEDKVGTIDFGELDWNMKVPAGNNWVFKIGDTPNSDIKNKLDIIIHIVNESKRDISMNILDLESVEINDAFTNMPDLVCIELPNCEVIGGNAFNGCNKLTKVVAPALREIGTRFFDIKEGLPEVEFIAATNPGVKLNCAYGGDDWVGEPLVGFAYKRVHLTLGNKEMFKSDEYGDNYLKCKKEKDPHAIYFGSITWQ